MTFVLNFNIAVELSLFRLPLRKAVLAARELGAQAVIVDARGELRRASCRPRLCASCGRF